jgi:hydrogenase maturation factor
MLPGPLLFLRYAFMPNQLGYCGGSDSQALLEYGIANRVDRGLLELERQFEGAFPYLELIARTNDIVDPLDRQVVEAYWIGNSLLDRVDIGALYASLEERFRPRTNSKDWPWLAFKAPAGAKPHHSFHVLEVYPRVGLMRSGLVDRLVDTMKNCLIRWGRVCAVSGPQLVVEAPTLHHDSGKLQLTEPRRETVVRWHDGRGFVGDVREGDWVAIHWGWACDVLTLRQQANLERFTRWHLTLCNQTI